MNPLEELQQQTLMGPDALAVATGVSPDLVRKIRRGLVRRPLSFVEGLKRAGLDGDAFLRSYERFREILADEARAALGASKIAS